jgi:hypothetical protein
MAMSDPMQQPDEGHEVLSLDPDAEREEQDEAHAFARLGGAAVPVAVVHLLLIFLVLQSAFGFELPRVLHADRVIAWLWVNGAGLALGAWLWRKGRVPVGKGQWLRGRRARAGVLLWLGLSLAWFLLPALLGDAWRAVSASAGGW